MRLGTYSGTISLDGEGRTLPSSRLSEHVVEALRKAQAGRVNVVGDRIKFSGGVFRFVSNWNVLVPFGHGQVEIDTVRGCARYELSLRQLFLGASIPLAMVGLITARQGHIWNLGYIALLWAWLFLGNLAVGIPRFHFFLKRALRCAT